MTKSAPLTDKQIEWAAELRSQGRGWRKIAHTVKGSEERLMRHFDPSRSIQRPHPMRGLNLDMPQANKPRAVAPDHVLQERDYRLSIERDQISTLMGDPPRGYSALDQKRRLACSIA